jgi:thiamine thiazole synthase
MKETEISKAIIEEYTKELLDYIESDVVIAGAGPAGLTAAYYLSKQGVKTCVIERKLSTGGGIWGGAAAYNTIVVDDAEILEELQITVKKKGDLYITDAVEFAAGLAYRAKQAGAKIFNLIEVEDIVVKNDKVCGAVLNATGIRLAKLHVDPFCMSSKCLVDGTGHPAELAHMLERRKPDALSNSIGEGFMDVESAEKGVVEKTGEIYDGLFVTGMSVCAVYGLPRMGPIFGGMLKSGKKAAELINEKL